MITNPSSHKRKLPILVILIAAVVVVLGAAAFWIFGRSNNTVATEYPQYLNFAGNYAFNVPKEYSVDEQSVLGIQLVYSGTFTVKTLADLYDVGGTSVQALTELKEGDNFREFVDKTFVPNLKKDAGTEDVQTKFGKEHGKDIARITVKKDAAMYRFIYLRSGKHPVALIAKDENDTLKKMAQTMVDVEDSVFKDEVEPIKTAIKKAGELAREQKVDELYDTATPELQAANSKEEVTQALKDAADYLNGNVTVSGGSLSDTQSFSAAMRFVKLDDTEQKSPAFGSLAVKKIDGQWKLEMLGLPSPKQQ